MSKKEMTFKDVMTKTSKIFKTDMTILYNKYCVGGKESEKETIGSFLLSLNDNSSECVKNEFQTENSIVIMDTKNAKDFYEINTKPNDSVEKDYHKKLDTLMSYIKKCDEWTSLKLSEEEKESIFTEGYLYNLFQERDDVPTLSIGKNMFPGISKKNISSISYHLFTSKYEDDLYKMVLKYDGDISQVYELIQFINYK